MLKFGVAAWAFLLNAMVFSANPTFSQGYPIKPVRIVTAAAGGGTDFVARLIAQGFSGGLGQPAIVDNRVSGVVQGEIVAHAEPDGYTLLVSSGNLWIAGFMQSVPYDAVRDFQPITLAATSPYILVVYRELAAKSVKELIGLAKTKPGELNYVSLAVGSSNHLAGELFKALAGVNIVRVSYKSAAIGTSDLISGQVQLMFTAVTSGAPHIKSGRLRALAVTGARPSALFPDLPTVGTTVPGYETAATYGVFAPAKTSAAVIRRLNHAIVNHLHTADVRERLFNAGVEVVGSSPEQFAAMIKLDMARWGKLIKDAGIRAD